MRRFFSVKNFGLLVIGLIFNGLIGCKQSMSPNELVKYINNQNNGLVKVDERGGVVCKLLYKPSLLLLHNEFSNKRKDSNYIERRRIYESYHYFLLSLSSDGKDVLYSGNPKVFSENLRKYSFRMYDNTRLITSVGDTVALADFYTPNLYGMGNETQILLAFEKPKRNSEEFKIQVDGLGFGKQNFVFKNRDLENIPQILEEEI